MADPRLNSVHLELPRRQEYRRARELLLRARGTHTICGSREEGSQLFGHTVIQRHDGSTSAPMACWLVDGEFLYPLKIGINTVGRSGDNDVVVEDAYASRRHCAILVHSNKSCELYDTASKNGTYVNGSRVSGPAPLKAGDEIRISGQQFIFQSRTSEDDSPSHHATLSE
jgi:hypothetical protein